MLKVSKIPQSKYENNEIVSFIKCFKNHNDFALYKVCNDDSSTIFITGDMLFNVLTVSENTYIKQAEKHTHYIRLKGQILLNKYGIMKLLTMSQEAIAFKLIDYIFEVIYKLEKSSVVSIDDIDSRKELMTLMQKISLHELTEKQNSTIISSHEEVIEKLKGDVLAADAENERLQKELDELTPIKDKYDKLKLTSIKLAKYVMINSKKPTIKAQELANEDDDFDADEAKDDPDAKLLIESDAYRGAKTLLKKNYGKYEKSSKDYEKSSKTYEKSTYYIFKSSVSVDGKNQYHIFNKLPIEGSINVGGIYYKDIIDYSIDYNLGTVSMAFPSVHYKTILIPNNNYEKMQKIFKILDYTSSEDIDEIIELFSV